MAARGLIESLKAGEAAAGSNVSMLMRNELTMGDVRILGCTLWTDYRLFADQENRTSREAMDAANQYLTDHKKIRHGAEYGRFRPQHALHLHDLDKQFLHERLAQPWAGKTVVITHHAPSARSIAPKFETDDLTPCYASNLETLMPGVNLWVHGHSHHAVDYQVGDTRVVCNPRGYESYSGREHTGWKQQLIIEV